MTEPPAQAPACELTASMQTIEGDHACAARGLYELLFVVESVGKLEQYCPREPRNQGEREGSKPGFNSGGGLRKGAAASVGDLVLLRPGDSHRIASSGTRLASFTLVFSADFWRAFVAAAGLATQAREWEATAVAPSRHLAPGERDSLIGLFHTVLAPRQGIGNVSPPDGYLGPNKGLLAPAWKPSRLEATAFLAQVLVFLHPKSDNESNDLLPPADERPIPNWLRHACIEMSRPDNLRGGLFRMVEISHVSRCHLTRMLKVHCGETPTGFINRLRLDHAARLLATTQLSILDIADECGFESASYFYRLFKKQHDQSPQSYRHKTRTAPAGIAASEGR